MDDRVFYAASVHDEAEIEAVVEVLRSGGRGSITEFPSFEKILDTDALGKLRSRVKFWTQLGGKSVPQPRGHALSPERARLFDVAIGRDEG